MYIYQTMADTQLPTSQRLAPETVCGKLGAGGHNRAPGIFHCACLHAGGERSLLESFRNLDGALKQAAAVSIENAGVCTVGGGNGTRGNLCESFSDLDDAMALAIRLGDDTDKNAMFGEKDYGYLDTLEEYDSSEREGSSICDDSYTSSCCKSK